MLRAILLVSRFLLKILIDEVPNKSYDYFMRAEIAFIMEPQQLFAEGEVSQ